MATATQTQSVAPEAQATTSQLSEPVAAAAAVVAKENPAFSQQLSEAVATQAVAYSVDPAAVAMSVTMMETLPPEMLEGLAASPSAHPVDKAAIAALTGYTGSPVPEIKETPAQKTEPVGETPAPIDLIESPPYPDVSTPAGQPVNDQPFLDKMDALVAANQLQLQTNKTHRIAQRQDGDWDVFEESDGRSAGQPVGSVPAPVGVGGVQASGTGASDPIATLNANIGRDVWRAATPDEVRSVANTQEYGAAETVAKAFGHELVPAVSSEADGQFDPQQPEKLFLDVSRPTSLLSVTTAHELGHGMEQNAPQLFNTMLAAIDKELKRGSLTAFAKDRSGYAGVPKGVLKRELVSDFIAEVMHRPGVVGRVAKQMDTWEKGSGKAFLDYMRDFLSYLKNALGSFNQTDKYFKDAAAIARAQQAVENALAQYGVARGVPTPSAFKAPQASVKRPTSDVGHKRRGTDGSYVGAPDWVTNGAQLTKLRKKLKQLVLDGASGRYWYEKSSKAVLDLVGGDKAEAEKFVGLLAIYSQGTEVNINAGFALEAYYQWKAGLPVNAGRFPVAQSAKAQAWLDKGEDWGGIKVNNFYADLMEEIDPGKVEDGHATMDMWMALAFDYGAKVLDQGPKYNFAKRETARLAKELGWKPHQVQAAIWTAIKSRVEGSEKARNAFELQEGIAQKNGAAHAIVKGREYDHFRAAHRFGMELAITPEEIAAQGVDFADALAQRMVQMSWEATPSVTGGDIPGIHTAPTAQKFEYLTAVAQALTENGKDLIAEAVGLHTPPTIFGYSAWEGAVGAGAQSFLPVPIVGQSKDRAVLPVARDLINQYAALKGLVMQQDAVVWHIPVRNDAKARNNGAELVTKRALTEAEMRALYDAIHQTFGTWELAPGYTSNGARVLNFVDGLDNKAFQKGMAQVHAALPDDFGGGDAVDMNYFRSDGDYVGNDWKEQPNGEGYYQTLRGRSPDIQGRAASLRARVEAVNRDFSERYGWDKPRASAKRQPDAGSAERVGGSAAQADQKVQPGYGVRRPGSVSAAAVHFSTQPRSALNSAYYGKGLKRAA
jgi:hypothetical protein